MPKATAESIIESAINARLQRTGIRLERRGDAYVLRYGKQVLFATDAAGQPLSLADVDHATRRFQ
jgi:hypothetical protein